MVQDSKILVDLLVNSQKIPTTQCLSPQKTKVKHSPYPKSNFYFLHPA